MIRLTLPFPPSANRYWRKFRNRMVRSQEATDYIEEVGLTHGHVDPIMGEVAVKMKFYRPAKRGDLDNMEKVALDSLRGVAYKDDNQIVRIEAERFDDKKNPRVEVTIEPYQRRD